MNTCSVIGLGYIGLPTAILIAKSGVKVFGIDIDPQLIENIKKLEFETNEPYLKEYLSDVIKNGSLTPQLEVPESDAFIICVPTPFEKKKEKDEIPTPNINYVLEGAKSISHVVKEDNLILLESTSPIGTTQKIANLISQESAIGLDKLNVAYCPERVIPGDIFQELVNNDRVIGGLTDKSSKICENLYKHFCKGQIIKTDARTAELIKLAENSFRDVNLAFANELSIICDKLNINSREVIKIANNHPRVKILNPGSGVGGHCIAVDPWFIVNSDPDNSKLIKTARKVNSYKSEWVFNKIKLCSDDFIKNNSFKPTIALMGIAYKPDVDDFRESAALKIALKCQEAKLNTIVCDPFIENIKSLNMIDMDSLSMKVDIYIFLVAHSLFKNLDLRGKEFIDFCGVKENH